MADFNAFPALDVKGVSNFDPIAAQKQIDDYQSEESLRPAIEQQKRNELDAANTDYTNSMLADAADKALAAPPDLAPKIWDDAMGKLSVKGVPGASQYIGRYNSENANKVKSAFGGGKTGAGAGGQGATVPPQFQQQMAQMTPDQLTKSLGLANTAISSWNRIASNPNATPNDLIAEVKQLSDAGMNVQQAIPGLDLSRTDPLGFRQNYALLSAAINNLVPKRDAMQEQASNMALGMPAAPPTPIKVGKDEVLLDPRTMKPIYTPPVPPQAHQFKTATETGGQPVDYDPATGTVRQFQGPDNYNEFADKFIGTEAGATPDAKNPNSSAMGNGQFINSTWLDTARKAVPGLANLDDKTLLAMRSMPGFSKDLTIALAKENASSLQGAGQPVNMSTVAMAGKLGFPDAMKVLKADPNTPLSKILSPAVIKANSDGIKNPADQFKNMTAGQYALKIHNQFGSDPVGQQSPFGTANEEPAAPDPNSQAITAQTGLSGNAFTWLTNPTFLPRDKNTRNAAQEEATKFLNKNGVDLATFRQEYKAANDILAANMKRVNQADIMQKEALGTIDNAGPAADMAGLGNLTAANWADLWAGKQVNNPAAQEYQVYLHGLRADLAGYFAALSGRGAAQGGGGQLNVEDYNQAADLIQNGISSGGLEGVRTALINTGNKMDRVLNSSVDIAHKKVWDLFGVGQNYKSKLPPAPEKYHAGDTVKGFTFKGGDWRDKNNWVKK